VPRISIAGSPRNREDHSELNPSASDAPDDPLIEDLAAFADVRPVDAKAERVKRR
jgi:hypothetical protein